MKKKQNGSVTLFSALIFLMVIAVFSATILSARLEASRVMVQSGLDLALSSVMSRFDNELLKEYGILLRDGTHLDSNGLSKEIEDYMSYTLNPDKGLIAFPHRDLLGIQSRGVSITNCTNVTEQGGLLFYDSAVAYEKYAKPIDLGADFLGIGGTEEEAEKVADISDEIVSCSQEFLDIQKQAQQITEFVDGVKLEEDGVDYAQIEVKTYFAKSIYRGSTTMEQASITDEAIFQAVTDSMWDVNSYLQKIKDAGDQGRFRACGSEADGLCEKISKIQEQYDQALELLDTLEEQINTTEKKAAAIETRLNKGDSGLSEPVAKGLIEETKQLEDYKSMLATHLFDMDNMKKTLGANRTLLDAIQDSLKTPPTAKDSFQSWYDNLDRLFDAMSYKGMSIRYAGIGSAEEDDSLLDKIQEFMNTGVLSLVKPKDAVLSEKEIKVQDLATSDGDPDAGRRIMQQCRTDIRLEKNIIYGEYVMDHFSSFTDKDNGGSMDYEIEYIATGKATDKDCLASVVYRIATIRSGINMMYLLTDSEKKQEAYLLAVTLAGATGIEPLIRILQYGILYAWAYAEGICDVKALLAGEKIALQKTRSNWSLQLTSLLSQNFGQTKSDQKGIGYEGYIRFLLSLEQESQKALRTMDMVELWKISKGETDYRMRKCIFGVEAEATYTIKGLSQVQAQNAVSSY